MKCSLLTLSCYVDAELPAPRRGELEAHLVGCHRCRAGLGHLREEVERVEGLARVHLPEGSVRLLLEHTGLIAAGDPMPAVPDAAAVAGPPPSTPPWLRGGAGAALPWATGRPPSPPRRPPAGLPASGDPPPPEPPPPAPDTFDIWAAARTDPPAEAPHADEAETLPEEPPPAAQELPSSTSDPQTARDTEIAAAVPPGGDAVPVWTPESSAETPPVPRYPLTDEDALDEPTTVERFGPMPAPRPGMVDRLREKMALRRALRVAALDDRDDSIEIVSGPGAPMRSPRSRDDLARRRSEALRPAARPDGAPWEGSEEAPPERPSRREPTVDELLPPPARPSGLGGPAARHPAPAPEPAAVAASAEGGRSARTVDGRRLTVVLGAAILVMFAVGVASARSTSPLPSTSSGSQAPAVTAPQAQHPAVAPPAPTAAVVAPPPHVATALPALTGTVTTGDGAPGWSVQDIRYGAHTGYLRMVVDLQPAAGAAAGSPRVTIGFQDPTTLIISLDQVVNHGAPAAPLAGGLVTSISLLTPPPAVGSTAYVVRLAHPVQFTPSFASGPLRLILDLH
ncbi:MAG TPA: zf-HC2 domain-containing protein [Candidatus Dormibacteraeota bacterium]|nr:zf-HC2 domain-containing protein [Candidatus Dormibacteraeota bacterium]